MVDVVTNHMAYMGCGTCVDYSQYNPFSSVCFPPFPSHTWLTGRVCELTSLPTVLVLPLLLLHQLQQPDIYRGVSLGNLFSSVTAGVTDTDQVLAREQHCQVCRIKLQLLVSPFSMGILLTESQSA